MSLSSLSYWFMRHLLWYHLSANGSLLPHVFVKIWLKKQLLFVVEACLSLSHWLHLLKLLLIQLLLLLHTLKRRNRASRDSLHYLKIRDFWLFDCLAHLLWSWARPAPGRRSRTALSLSHLWPHLRRRGSILRWCRCLSSGLSGPRPTTLWRPWTPGSSRSCWH